MTLDSMLKSRAVEQLRERMQTILDFDPQSLNRWTTSNRDEKMAQMRAVGDESCDSSMEFMQELMSCIVDGKPLLWWHMRVASIESEVQLLVNLREEYDVTARDARGDVPVDPVWLSEEITKRYEEIGEINLKLETSLEKVGQSETEEL